MNKPKVGAVLNTTVDPRVNNGLDEAPALVTNVVDDDNDDYTLNLRVFLDTGADLVRKGVKLMSKRPVEDSDNVETNASGTQLVAWRP